MHFDYESQEAWPFESGKSQSPIDIETGKAQDMIEDGILTFGWEEGSKEGLHAVDNGHAIQVNAEGMATLNGRRFALTQFHFHSPSEHTVDGRSYAIEGHFVHAAQDGRLAVVGVFYTEGEENAAFGAVLGSVAGSEGFAAKLAELLPIARSYYHYNGSLTTPPLTENVEWYVFIEPVELSAAQIEAFRSYYARNNRDAQPLNGRSVLYHSEL